MFILFIEDILALLVKFFIEATTNFGLRVEQRDLQDIWLVGLTALMIWSGAVHLKLVLDDGGNLIPDLVQLMLSVFKQSLAVA